jgi:hypothetical protein
MGRAPGPKPVAGREEVGFEDRLEHDLGCRHHHPVGHTRDAKRPELSRPARLGDTHPPQRPRTVPARPELHGEFVKELIDPEVFHVIDRYAIDTGGPSVHTNLPPRPVHDVAAGDLVMQGMKTAILILLGTAVEHALESTNPVHAGGVADGPSRNGTHQVPLLLLVHR